jgi:hypothetical protein
MDDSITLLRPFVIFHQNRWCVLPVGSTRWEKLANTEEDMRTSIEIAHYDGFT